MNTWSHPNPLGQHFLWLHLSSQVLRCDLRRWDAEGGLKKSEIAMELKWTLKVCMWDPRFCHDLGAKIWVDVTDTQIAIYIPWLCAYECATFMAWYVSMRMCKVWHSVQKKASSSLAKWLKAWACTIQSNEDYDRFDRNLYNPIKLIVCHKGFAHIFNCLYEIAKGENALKVFDFRRFRAFQMKQDHWIKQLAVEVCCRTSEKTMLWHFLLSHSWLASSFQDRTRFQALMLWQIQAQNAN